MRGPRCRRSVSWVWFGSHAWQWSEAPGTAAPTPRRATWWTALRVEARDAVVQCDRSWSLMSPTRDIFLSPSGPVPHVPRSTGLARWVPGDHIDHSPTRRHIVTGGKFERLLPVSGMLAGRCGRRRSGTRAWLRRRDARANPLSGSLVRAVGQTGQVAPARSTPHHGATDPGASPASAGGTTC